MEYDYLVYALGSMTDRQSIPGVDQYAYSLSASGPFSASDLRERLPEIEARGGQVVVCGAGATGIETAAQVASVYPHIKVSLVTRGAFANSWNSNVTDHIRRRLISLGVEIIEQGKVFFPEQALWLASRIFKRPSHVACTPNGPPRAPMDGPGGPDEGRPRIPGRPSSETPGSIKATSLATAAGPSVVKVLSTMLNSSS